MDALIAIAQTASPAFSVFCVVVLVTVIPVLWKRLLKEIDNSNRMSQAVLKASEAQAKSNLAVARALAELNGKVVALNGGSGRKHK